MRVHQTSDLHRQIEKLPNVERFLSSLKRNSLNTSNGYKTPIAYFHEFLLSNHNQTADSHYDIIKHFQLYGTENEMSDGKNRLWHSENDNKFVSALYIAQRSLEKHGLIKKERDDDTRKITELEPTHRMDFYRYYFLI